MSASPDLPTLEIRASAAKQIAYLAGAVAAVPALTAFALLADDISIVARLASLLSVALIVGLTPGIVRKALAARGRVLALSVKGLRDFRASSSVVPWEEITGFWEQNTSGVRFLRIGLTEAGWTGMAMSRWVRLLASRRAEPYFVINAQTTGVAFDDLVALIAWYHGVTVGQLPAGTPAPIAIDAFRTDQLVAA